MIEFSLTLPLLLLIVLGIIEFGLIFREYEVITNAAREGGSGTRFVLKKEAKRRMVEGELRRSAASPPF